MPTGVAPPLGNLARRPIGLDASHVAMPRLWCAGSLCVRSRRVAMKRRSFLKSAAAVFPAAGLGAFSFGQAGSAPAAEGIHPVGAGQDR